MFLIAYCKYEPVKIQEILKQTDHTAIKFVPPYTHIDVHSLPRHACLGAVTIKICFQNPFSLQISGSLACLYLLLFSMYSSEIMHRVTMPRSVHNFIRISLIWEGLWPNKICRDLQERRILGITGSGTEWQPDIHKCRYGKISCPKLKGIQGVPIQSYHPTICSCCVLFSTIDRTTSVVVVFYSVLLTELLSVVVVFYSVVLIELLSVVVVFYLLVSTSFDSCLRSLHLHPVPRGATSRCWDFPTRV